MSERNTGRETIWQAGRFTWDLKTNGLIMGILNTTPDSFSDGGCFHNHQDALAHGLRMIEEGADILDIGGESTRPGSLPVGTDEELERTIPVIELLRKQTTVALSIDTSKPEVAKAALRAGVDIVNDITGFRNPEMTSVVADSECGLVAMHMRGRPETMQDLPEYHDVVSEVAEYFETLLCQLHGHGIPLNRVVLDPGIGFGKSLNHNLALLKGISALLHCNRPLLIGVSRKSLIADLLSGIEVEEREFPTVALTSYCSAMGAQIHRVHAVKENMHAQRLAAAINS